MRLAAKTLIAAIAALLILPAPLAAQDAAPTPAVNPQGPVPYSTLRRPVKPKRVTRPAAAAPIAAAVAPGATAQAQPLPVAAPPAAPGARLAPSDPLPPAELEAFADGLIRDAMDREHIAGVTVSVVQNGQILLKKGYGAASLSPVRKVDPDTTLFRIGSISKTFTWIALMREVEAGRIRIDGPINLYLPEDLQVRDQGFRAPVRVINLMDHSAGFEDRGLGQLIERDLRRERPLAEYLRQERPRRVHAPGAMASYSNYGAALAGEAVSYVTGKPYEQLIEEEILRPLALGHTTFREVRAAEKELVAPMSASLAGDVSEGFRWTPAGFKARPYELLGHIAPAGAASSTAADMARYMTALLNDGTLDGASIFGPRAAKAFRTPIRQAPDGINGWAHGFIVYDLPGGHRGYGHDGATLSFVSRMIVVPDLKLGVFISTNTETGGDLVRRFPDRLMRQFYLRPQIFPRPAVPALAAEAKRYEGDYLGSRRAYGGLEGFIGMLRAGVTVEVAPEGRLLTSAGGETHAWVPVGDPAAGRFVSATDDQHLAFVIQDGRAVAMMGAIGEQVYERTSFWREGGLMATFAALSLICAVATFAGIFFRNRREFRETSIQNRAGLIQNIQSILWVTSFSLFAVWLSKTGDSAVVMYDWPGFSLRIASACAVVSAVLTLVTAVVLPAVWRGGRRVDSWTQIRKAGFTFTVLTYLGFSILLLLWGALEFWRG